MDPYEEDYETSLELPGQAVEPEPEDQPQVDASSQIKAPVKTSNKLSAPMDTGNSSSYTPISLPFGSAAASPWNVEPHSRPSPAGKPPTSEVEMVQLLRYFANVPGQWMDLFDTQAYYSRRVTILAARSPLLKYAASSLAAKCLYRIRRNDSISAPSSGDSRSPEDYHRGNENDWHYKSVEYYDHAIRLLRETTQFDQQQMYGSSFKSDEVLAAIALLATYELMDAPGTEWRAHLSALLLLDTPSTALLSSPSINEIPRSIGNHSIFWNFARQDYLAAFIGETRTRLDTTDVHLWRRFGLSIDDAGLLLPYSSEHLDNHSMAEPSDRAMMHTSFEEDAVCNALFWLLGKIVNFLAVGDGLQPGDYELPPGFRNHIGIAQESLLENWTQLAMELATWYETLPPTFIPSVRKVSDPHPDAIDQPIIPSQVWHAVPMCASAMQHYHMARIILLINKPMESTAIRSSVTARLSSYRVIQQEVLRHSREIYAISMSDPADTVRIHSVQPLFVAGQCLTEPWERDTVLDLLVGIQRELGWATEYRIKTLMEQWNAEYGGANRLLLPPTPG